MSAEYKRLGLLTALLTNCTLVAAQTAAPPPPTAGAPPATMSASLGVYVFPAKNQTAEQQQTDEAACFSWAKTQTGIDPLSSTPPAAPAQPAPSVANAGKGAPARGAVGGAVAGTAIGAVAGDAGKGAAIGATAGAIGGVRAKRQAQVTAEAQQKQAAATTAQQTQAQVAQQKATYNKAFSACLEGKGYSVK
jgi:hypothetical protein